MATQPTNLPVPSETPRDLKFNAGKIDEFVTSLVKTYIDRFGKQHYTIEGLRWLAQQAIAQYGWIPVGTFQAGAMLTLPNHILKDETDNEYYRWDGSFLPSGKVVPAGSTPASSGGIGTGKWLSMGDAVLRGELANPAIGDVLLALKLPFTGSVARTQHDKNAEHITPQDFGARGDSVTDDTAVFALIDAAMSGQEIDLLGKTYYVSSIPTGNRYFNGSWQLPAGPARGRWQGAQLTGAGRIAFGDGALASLPTNYEVGELGTVIAQGAGAMGKMTQVKKAIAIGPNSQGDGTCSRDNISIGEDSLRFVQSRTPDYDQSQQQGTRNIAFGSNAGRFIVEGSHNVITGRNAGQCIVNGTHSAIYGSNAVGGYAPVGLSGVIENWAPNNGPDGVSAFGDAALNRITTGFNAAFGQNTLSSLVVGRGNSAFGIAAMQNAESNLAFNGGILTTLNINGTYSHAGNVLTINAVAHGAAVGDIVGIRLLDGGSQTFQGDVCPAYVTTVINANSFTVAHPVSRTATGNSTLYWRTTAAAGPKSEFNTAFGGNAAGAMIRGSENSVFGYGVMINANDAAADTSRNTAFGFRALSGWTSPQLMTAFGHDALRFMQDGSVATGAGTNCTGIGRSSRVSGNNQVQLGDASTTTYVYGTVQNRSDERDKADIRDTVLGIDFIMGLRPVDGRWDMRDDYFEEYQVQTGIDSEARPVFETRLRKIPRDGSKKRERYHHWFIAQEVKGLCEKLGVEFGGYQDHKVNDGCDVLSLGYDEFIPPTVRAVQQCWERLDSLEKRLAKLEAQ
ncbi:hypothetical protein ABKV41_14440 [Enterobacter roggenkampii]|uniref:tail fiber/spike domain-containing protein n=1 Tax=Enterobacter roggenkampii TaxID=1812935 RepID=UPI0032AF342B